jgi:superfamily II DNA or RNA helicase
VISRLAAVELQEKGILSQCHVNIRQLVDHGEYRDYQSELKYLVDNADRMAHISKMIADIAQSGNTLVLVDRLSAGNHICATLPDAVFISGKDKLKDRKAQYDQMAVSDNKITVATYGVAAVGIDIPRLFNVVLIEPGKSFVRTIQSIGRGLRKAQDKDMVQIWDITSTMKFSKRHLTKRKSFYSEAEYPFTIEKVDWQR